jgi:HD superfamily phosphohydrolase
VFDIIEHPYFQRLRRIKQLGLTDFVYPGALHTRFHHAIGAMHLMTITLENLRAKGVAISDEEFEAAQVAILIHDIGHGPFSHTLEFSLFKNISHESLSLMILRRLNNKLGHDLTLAEQIFTGKYHRPFFNQLVSSQLDIDRLDYLMRDSFFTGVSEGTIGADRIIKMLAVHADEIVVEEKGIYSIENFLSSRRLMYWQVYLHKTSLSAENMLISLIKRARLLTQQGHKVEATTQFRFFLERTITMSDFESDEDIIEVFMLLDDTDIWASIKYWLNHEDVILSTLSRMLLERNLFQIKLTNDKVDGAEVTKIRKKVEEKYGISESESKYFVRKGEVSNAAYVSKDSIINIMTKKGEIVDVAVATDLPNIKAMSKIVKKYYLCWPKGIVA